MPAFEISRPERGITLTPNQGARQIAQRVASFHWRNALRSSSAIGEALGLSAHTVRNLLTETRRRVGAANRAELVRLAVLR